MFVGFVGLGICILKSAIHLTFLTYTIRFQFREKVGISVFDVEFGFVNTKRSDKRGYCVIGDSYYEITSTIRNRK